MPATTPNVSESVCGAGAILEPTSEDYRIVDELLERFESFASKADELKKVLEDVPVGPLTAWMKLRDNDKMIKALGIPNTDLWHVSLVTDDDGRQTVGLVDDLENPEHKFLSYDVPIMYSNMDMCFFVSYRYSGTKYDNQVMSVARFLRIHMVGSMSSCKVEYRIAVKYPAQRTALHPKLRDLARAMIQDVGVLQEKLKTKGKEFIEGMRRNVHAEDSDFVNQAALARMEEQLLDDNTLSPAAVTRLLALLVKGDDFMVLNINPGQLSKNWGMDFRTIMNVLIAAHSLGYLGKKWEFLCPNCRQTVEIRDHIERFLESRTAVHCWQCERSFCLSDNGILILAFTVRDDVRKATDARACMGGPSRLPHIISCVQITPGANVTMYQTLGCPREKNYWFATLSGSEEVAKSLKSDKDLLATAKKEEAERASSSKFQLNAHGKIHPCTETGIYEYCDGKFTKVVEHATILDIRNNSDAPLYVSYEMKPEATKFVSAQLALQCPAMFIDVLGIREYNLLQTFLSKPQQQLYSLSETGQVFDILFIGAGHGGQRGAFNSAALGSTVAVVHRGIHKLVPRNISLHSSSQAMTHVINSASSKINSTDMHNLSSEISGITAGQDARSVARKRELLSTDYDFIKNRVIQDELTRISLSLQQAGVHEFHGEVFDVEETTDTDGEPLFLVRMKPNADSPLNRFPAGEDVVIKTRRVCFSTGLSLKGPPKDPIDSSQIAYSPPWNATAMATQDLSLRKCIVTSKDNPLGLFMCSTVNQLGFNVTVILTPAENQFHHSIDPDIFSDGWTRLELEGVRVMRGTIDSINLADKEVSSAGQVLNVSDVLKRRRRVSALSPNDGRRSSVDLSSLLGSQMEVQMGNACSVKGMKMDKRDKTVQVFVRPANPLDYDDMLDVLLLEVDRLVFVPPLVIPSPIRIMLTKLGVEVDGERIVLKGNRTTNPGVFVEGELGRIGYSYRAEGGPNECSSYLSALATAIGIKSDSAAYQHMLFQTDTDVNSFVIPFRPEFGYAARMRQPPADEQVFAKLNFCELLSLIDGPSEFGWVKIWGLLETPHTITSVHVWGKGAEGLVGLAHEIIANKKSLSDIAWSPRYGAAASQSHRILAMAAQQALDKCESVCMV